MLQRAASNAYSWWWASHIRTKQSKWMEQNLQDMEEKVQGVLKLLEEDGDSFAKRANMYFKNRPEMINFVEESFRAYRSLADRYDHISTELQQANNTIASVCPDQVPYMDDDDDASPRPPRKMPEVSKPVVVPNIPKPPVKDLKSIVTMATKKLNPKNAGTKVSAKSIPKSGLGKKELREEIDKFQKQILALQTVKEFVKSSYDSANARYWETEEQINELQEKVSGLQDELGEGIVIDDEEARRLMAEAALKSCQETLSQLQEKQALSLDETRIESKRIKDVMTKLNSLMDEFDYDQTDPKDPRAKREVKEIVGTKDLDEDVEKMTQQRQELQLLQDKIKEHFEAGSYSALTVSEMAEKIDELVTKVISLETAVSSQTALVKRLRIETDELHSLVRNLEGDKEILINDKAKLNDHLKEMEEKLHEVQDMNQIVEDQNSNLQTHFTEAHCNLDHLSEKIQDVKQDEEEVEVRNISLTEMSSSSDGLKDGLETQDASDKDGVLSNDFESYEKVKATASVEDHVDKELMVTNMVEDVLLSDNKLNLTGSSEEYLDSDNELKVTDSLQLEKALENSDTVSTIAGNQEVGQHQADTSPKSSVGHQENDFKHISSKTESTPKGNSQDQSMTQEDEPDWRQLFTNGMQDKEKVLLSEYTNTLRNYKDVKNKLAELEKQKQDTLFDSSLQLKELKTANALKDEEIRLLHQKLDFLKKKIEENVDLGELTSLQPPQDHDIHATIKIEELETTSAVEEKFRTDIDELLEENLAFWFRFSTSFNGIQKFETTIKDLLTEVSKIDESLKKSTEGSSSTKYSLKSDARPLYKHLAEIQTELTVWLESTMLLKEELQHRFSSLCEIQEEIRIALNTSAGDDDFKFTSYQAAKFQGEILNMKQENNKVADELQAGLDLVTSLQLDVEKALAKLNEQFGLSNSKRVQGTNSESHNRVPLRSFIFGVKPKKQKQSIFSCMTPAMHRKYRASKG
ncbi:PREDICTED: protein NETWORKED 2D-like [Lupinus angustifolius]|nr:PREDICTED: protein NETWORKED 2D-like [Lupinus angustifolius]